MFYENSSGAEFYGTIENPIAIVIRNNLKVESIEFFSPNDFPQQLGLMSRPAGYQVKPHIHNEIPRVISRTQEVLLVRKGKCEVSLYENNAEFIGVLTLEVGDVILLSKGGHGIKMLEDCELLEVKQGPYLLDEDKFFIGEAD